MADYRQVQLDKQSHKKVFLKKSARHSVARFEVIGFSVAARHYESNFGFAVHFLDESEDLQVPACSLAARFCSNSIRNISYSLRTWAKVSSNWMTSVRNFFWRDSSSL